MHNKYKEIVELIENLEVKIKVREYKDNNDKLNTYWNIGKLIVEAQENEPRSKYGLGLINEWAKKLEKIYGTNYNSKNLMRYRQFYLLFQKVATVW